MNSQQPHSQIQLALIDDDVLMTELLQEYLSGIPDLNVLFTADSGDALLEKLETADPLPDILLLDLKMEGKSGMEVMEIVRNRYPSMRVMAISSFYKDAYLGFMLKTGAAAFVPKGILPSELVTIIRQVYAQGFHLSEAQLDQLKMQLAGNLLSPELEEGRLLSEREVEIVRLICEQKTAKEIGEHLFITQRTVEGHKNSIFAKTGAKNIAGLVIYALQTQIINPANLPLIS